jgi:hypothetical protein
MRKEKIDPRWLSLEANIHMDHLQHLRYHDGEDGPTLRTIRRLVCASSRILRRAVTAEELFEVNDGTWKAVKDLDGNLGDTRIHSCSCGLRRQP